MLNQRTPSSLADSVITYLGRGKAFPHVEFPDEQVVTNQGWLQVPPFGILLRVPANTCCVMADPSGRQMVYAAGDHLIRYPAGNYPLRFVDLRRQSTRLEQVEAASRDAWNVQLKLDIVWQVSIPERVIQVHSPLAILRSAWQAAVIDYIQSSLHDALVPVPGSTVVDNGAIVKAIKDRLFSIQVCSGFEVLEVMVLERKGDQRRTEVIQKATVDKTEIQQTASVQQAKVLQLEQQEAVTLKEARIARLKAEQEDQVRLRKAEITADEAEILRTAQLQAVEMKLKAEAQQQQHEQTLKSLEVRGQAFGQLAAAILQMQMVPGLQRNLDEEGRQALVHVLEALAQNMPAISPGANPAPALGNGGPPLPATLRERLAAEVGSIMALPGARCEPLESIGPDLIRVVVGYLGLRFTFECGGDFPDKPPRGVMVKKDNYPPLAIKKFHWSRGASLRDVVLEIVDRASRGLNFNPKRAGDEGGTDFPKSYAG